MQRHWKRPWISLAVLAAVAGSTLARPAPVSRAQSTTYPGESDPLGTRAGALTPFPDDELITVSDAAGDSAYQIAETSPNPDYTVPASPALSDPLDDPPSPGLPTPFGGYQHVSVTAQGRIVVPNRDVALALTKTNYNAATATISWALQEMSFGGSVPSAPASVPPLTWSTPGVLNQSFAATTPGALAVGDLDRVMTPNPTYGATYNDEAVVAYEVRDPTNANNAQVKLDVVSYVAAPGTATVVATTTTTTSVFANLSYAYVCSSGALSRGGACDVLHPGNINVATGDLDGDGYQDIVLFAMLYHSTDNTVNQLAYLYTYCPAQLAQDDPRVAPGACPVGAAGASLVVKGPGAVVSGTLNEAVNGALFHSPAELTIADFDGDGVQELAVLHQTNALYRPGGSGTYDQYIANVTLSLLQWTATSTSLQTVWSNEQSMPITNTWTDAGGHNGGGLYYDMHMAAGLFKFSPELGYTLNRRQLAVASTNWLPNNDDGAQPTLAIELWDFSSPNSPGPNPPSQWTFSRYSSQQAGLCNNQYTQNYASFALVAGNWAGVKANPSSPLWGVGLAFEYATGAFDAPEIVTQLYRVDQNIDATTANGPLTLASMQTLPANNGGAGSCGSTGRVEVVSLDFDGDALTLGPPMHSVVSVPQVYDSILQEPPQHLDYFPFGDGMVNVSRRSDFNISYGDSTGKSFSTSTNTTSDWTAGTSVKANATVGIDGDYLIAKANLSASVTNQFNYDYDNNKSDYSGASLVYTSTLTTQTAGGDSVRFRAKTFDLWRYPAYGLASPNPGQPYAYYELLLPRPYPGSDETMDGLQAQAYGYQPIHENGNILSYPAVPAGKTLEPADAGQWLLPESTTAQNKPAGAVLCQNGARYCLSDPLTNTDQQFYFGATNNTTTLQVDQGNTSGGSRSWNNKLSDSLDVEVSSKFVVFGASASGSVNAEVHGGYSWGQSSTWTNASDETQSLALNVPATNNASQAYHFNPVMYITGDGTIKVAHGTGTGSANQAETFWTDNYINFDPALNLPRKFYQPSTTGPWGVNKDWVDSQQLRGFWVRSATPNPLGSYDVVDGVAAGQQVLLDARVYNYSVATPVQANQLQVNFDLEPVDPTRNFIATGPRKTYTTIANTAAIPFHGQQDSSGNVLPNYTTVSYQLDTSTLPAIPTGTSSQTYRVWVVLNPQDPSDTANETHGWRQPNVVLTPKNQLERGASVQIGLQNTAGTVLETVTYRSNGTNDDIVTGLAAALNASTTLQNFGASAVVQDTGTPTPSVSVSTDTAEPPAANEHRAGLVDGDQALYFVPLQGRSSTPLATASNLEYGQNNEGWGLLTVNTATTPGPMLGADDPLALGSGYSAERGPDVQLRRTSLTPMPANARMDGSKVVVRAGDRVPMRVTAHTGMNWAGFERVTVFQGEPEDGGLVAGTALIRGIDAKSGGHGWFTWQAPTLPGTYTLVARLNEAWNDSVPGNNEALVEIVVEAGPQLPYRRFLGAISRGPQ